MSYYMEARTVYGRTVYCVKQGPLTLCRCDSHANALLIIDALNAQSERGAK